MHHTFFKLGCECAKVNRSRQHQMTQGVSKKIYTHIEVAKIRTIIIFDVPIYEIIDNSLHNAGCIASSHPLPISTPVSPL